MRVPSPPSQGAWIEMLCEGAAEVWRRSPPSQGAWIEIVNDEDDMRPFYVAPLAGGVD